MVLYEYGLKEYNYLLRSALKEHLLYVDASTIAKVCDATMFNSSRFAGNKKYFIIATDTINIIHKSTNNAPISGHEFPIGGINYRF